MIDLRNTVGILHERVRLQLQRCLDDSFVPGWMTKRKTVLLQKYWSKRNIASSSTPVTFLPFVCKWIIDIIADKIYG